MTGNGEALTPNGEPSRSSYRGAFIAAAAVAGLLFCGVLWFVGNAARNMRAIFPPSEPKPFNSEEWKAWSLDTPRSKDRRAYLARQDMLDDLLARHDFSGWEVDQIENLLGPPDPKFQHRDWNLAYLLGMEWTDFVLLVFKLDDNGKVASSGVVIFDTSDNFHYR
jgi:hypothetical protein